MSQTDLNKTDVKISDLKPIEAGKGSGGIDFEKYHMKPYEIEKVSIIETMTGYKDNKLVELDEPRKQLLVETVVLETGKDKDGKEFEVRAKEWFNLIENEDGSVGWSMHEKASLKKFLDAMRINTPEGLIGKLVTIKVVEKEDSEGQKKHRLRFVY